jgi:hypothetical protein
MQEGTLKQSLREWLLAKIPEFIQTMFAHLQAQVSGNTVREIREALKSEVKAFPRENHAIWTPSIENLPADVLLLGEKERFLKILLDMRHTSEAGQSLKDDVLEIK